MHSDAAVEARSIRYANEDRSSGVQNGAGGSKVSGALGSSLSTKPRTRTLILLAVVIFMGGFGIFRAVKIETTHQASRSDLALFLVGVGAVVFTAAIMRSARGMPVSSSLRRTVSFVVIVDVLLLILAMPEKNSNAYFFSAPYQLVGDGVMVAIGVLVLGAFAVSSAFRSRFLPVNGDNATTPASDHVSIARSSSPSNRASSPKPPPEGNSISWLLVEEFHLRLKGYNVDDVDAYIDNVVRRNSMPSEDPVQPDELRRATFRIGLKGYDIGEVDAAMEKAASDVVGVSHSEPTDSSLAWLHDEQFHLRMKGYRVSDVDSFIADVIQRSSSSASSPIQPDELRHKKFKTASPGYNPGEIDAVLAKAADQLGSSWR